MLKVFNRLAIALIGGGKSLIFNDLCNFYIVKRGQWRALLCALLPFVLNFNCRFYGK